MRSKDDRFKERGTSQSYNMEEFPAVTSYRSICCIMPVVYPSKVQQKTFSVIAPVCA